MSVASGYSEQPPIPEVRCIHVANNTAVYTDNTQKQYTKDGVNYIEMKQTEYIETLVSQYADEIKA
eukprot:SAG31_NODE_14977_length_777_cov_1.594395_1_plen_65_part_10